MGAHVAGSVLLFVFAVAMGAAFTWDIGGLATKMRQRLEAKSIFGDLYKRMPSWTFRAFGVWCFVCGIGWLIYVYSLRVACGGSRLQRRVTRCLEVRPFSRRSTAAFLVRAGLLVAWL